MDRGISGTFKARNFRKFRVSLLQFCFFLFFSDNFYGEQRWMERRFIAFKFLYFIISFAIEYTTNMFLIMDVDEIKLLNSLGNFVI